MKEELSKFKINGAFVTKKEADEAGVNYDIYDYEARMIPLIKDMPVIKGDFRVVEDMAMLINENGTGYLIIKIDDPENKHISFERIRREIKIAGRDAVFGQTFKTKDLLEAIKNSLFTDDAIINIHTDRDSDSLTIVYKCKECNSLHLLAGELDYETFNEISSDSEKVYSKNPLTVNDKEEYYVSRGELVSILESIDEDIPVTIGTLYNPNIFTLTGVYKCSEKCPAIHFTCFYDEHTHSIN